MTAAERSIDEQWADPGPRADSRLQGVDRAPPGTAQAKFTSSIKEILHESQCIRWVTL